MRVFITGATGFVGRALVQRLLGAGHGICALVRDPERARDRLGPDVELCRASADGETWAKALAGCDAVVNLAGESVLGARWTAARRRALATSRVELTRQLTAAMKLAQPTPRVLISASAVGYYGERAAEPLVENSGAGPGFLAQLCVAWERAAEAVNDDSRDGTPRVRVALLRTGIVLGMDGGALAAMLPAFRLGFGGPIGGGEQYLPWIHLDDLTEVIVRGLSDDRFAGPFNLSAPLPVSSRDFAAELGRALGRPARMPLPAFALRLVLGARAEAALQSQRALPAALQHMGHVFQYAELPAALKAILSAPAAVSMRRAAAGERTDLPSKPAYVLEHRSRMRVPLTEAFAFFCKAQNLGLITPSWMRFAMAAQPPDELHEGSELTYRIGLGPVLMRWKTIIRSWSPPHGFVDMQASGPYALWWHEHLLEAAGDETEMIDRVYYSPPLGLVGRLVHPLFIGPMLRAIFAYRAAATQRLFGVARTANAELVRAKPASYVASG